MKLPHKLLTAALALATPMVMANQFSSNQTKEIQSIVHSYLTENPEVLIEASQSYKNKQMQAMKGKANQFIGKHKKDFFQDSTSPIAGNPKGNVTIVEFFDYQCGHCKQMSPTINKLIKEDKNLRVVFKQLPIFKGSSAIAAKAALAAQQQGKFLVLHEALMSSKKPLSEESILAMAKKQGLDTKKLQKDMNSKVVSAQIDANMKLAQAFLQESMGYVFTPVFVAANQNGSKFEFIPGGLDLAGLHKIVDQLRK